MMTDEKFDRRCSISVRQNGTPSVERRENVGLSRMWTRSEGIYHQDWSSLRMTEADSQTRRRLRRAP